VNKQDIAAYFDALAPRWDAELIRRDAVIEQILRNADIASGMDVLDVACGTGVLLQDYLNRDVNSVYGVDISGAMIAHAKRKFADVSKIHLYHADIETLSLPLRFDRVMLYNALPHFPSMERIVETLCAFCKTGGRVTIAHGMSRAQINSIHAARAGKISQNLLPAEELASLLRRYLDVDIVVSDEHMYQVCGQKIERA